MVNFEYDIAFPSVTPNIFLLFFTWPEVNGRMDGATNILLRDYIFALIGLLVDS